MNRICALVVGFASMSLGVLGATVLPDTRSIRSPASARTLTSAATLTRFAASTASVKIRPDLTGVLANPDSRGAKMDHLRDAWT